jgi:hypothetical protein
MKKTAIIAIVEPLSFALNTSAAWALTRTLNAGHTFTLLDTQKTDVGTLIGLTPVLQPIKTMISGQSGFFLAMRAVLDVTAGFVIESGAKYSLVDSNSSAKGSLTSCSSARHAYTAPFILLSPQLPQLAPADVAALQNHVVYLTESLWHKEPINWTTHWLQYASTGQLMTKNEIVASGLATGMPIFANGMLSIAPGPKPLHVPFGRWPRAGVTTTVGVLDAAEASCDSSDVSTGATTGDGPC